MTWRDVDPTEDLDGLIERYFADQKILATLPGREGMTSERLRQVDDAGYDGRLFDWLTEMVSYGPADGPEQAWPVVLELIARAPDDDALGFIGAGPVESLVNKHGVTFLDRFLERADDPRFRRACGDVWLVNDEIPIELRELIEACRLARPA